MISTRKNIKQSNGIESNQDSLGQVDQRVRGGSLKRPLLNKDLLNLQETAVEKRIPKPG